MKTGMIIGSGRGIGFAVATRLAAQGINLILTELLDYIDELQEKADKLTKIYGIRIDIFALDIRDIANIAEVFREIDKRNLDVSYLVCNAGVNYLSRAIEVTEEMWDEIHNINVKGHFFVMQEAAKQMIMRDGGSIVAIGSQHGLKPNYDRAPYCASKAALIHLCRELALEWAEYHIRVNTVSPGYVLYDSNKELLLSSKGKRQYLNRVPLYKYCSEEDVAYAVAFLLGQEAKMITGHNLLVDGGWMLK